MTRVMLHVVVGVGIAMISGCAYFHPAFVTNPRVQTAQSSNGVLVCERHSLGRSDCAVMSHEEISRLLSETTARY